jgi:hypothetical protein
LYLGLQEQNFILKISNYRPKGTFRTKSLQYEVRIHTLLASASDFYLPHIEYDGRFSDGKNEKHDFGDNFFFLLSRAVAKKITTPTASSLQARKMKFWLP